ncbi:MAG: four helix bundle protein, partial [Chlorobium sp.]
SLVINIYEITKGFPKDELYGLTQQMRRAAVSIPSNIAEGAARNSVKEYAHFISIARGSLAELETQYKIAQMLEYCQESILVSENINHLARLLTGLYKKWS